MLRNGGQDWYRTLFRDGMMQTLVKDRMDIDWQAYKPAIVFLNGEYWGIHSIREKHNEHYLEVNYNIDPDKIDILSNNSSVKQGSAEHHYNLINFLKANDISLAENYEYIKTQMDVNEYLNYQIAEIYFANIDWPGGNIKFWRPQTESGRWRWILFDTDLGFGAHSLGQYDSNSLENATTESATYYANPSWATFLFRKLLENKTFKHQFIQRFASHINTTFHQDRVKHIIDSLKTHIAPEIPRHKLKWEDSISFDESWEALLQKIYEFAEKRPDFVKQHIIDKFELNGTALLKTKINEPGRGKILINNVSIPDFNYQGIYFKNIPITCKAIPNNGFCFTGWQGLSGQKSNSITIVLTDDDSLTALFEPVQYSLIENIYINEFLAINNNTISDEAGEYDDWIELYNHGDDAVDISGLYITDDLNNPFAWQIPFSQPELTTIQPGRFLILWADNDIEQGDLHVNIKLSGDGEQIGLAQKTETGYTFIDSLNFSLQAADISIGRYPDGGASMNPFTEPTPGAKNIISSSILKDPMTPLSMKLGQNYPNPFNPVTTINFRISESVFTRLKVYDLMGKEVATLVNKRMPEGFYEIIFNGNNLPGGLYFYKIEAGGFKVVKKLLLIK